MIKFDLIDEVICSDCNAIIKELPDASIDLVVTSPNYNVDLGNNKYRKTTYDVCNDNKEHFQYIMSLHYTFNLLEPKMKSGGRICINIGDGKNGAIPTHSDIIRFMVYGIGYLPLTTIIWNKNQTSNRAAFGSYLSPSCPSFPGKFEYILVFAKDDRKLRYKGETDLTKEEFVQWTDSIWTFPPERNAKKLGHPSPFPVELPHRCIKMFSWVGAVVFDPFAGIGTTGLAAKRLNRRYILTDISKDYCNKARERIAKG